MKNSKYCTGVYPDGGTAVLYRLELGDIVSLDNLPPKHNIYTEEYVVAEQGELYGVNGMPRIVPEITQAVFKKNNVTPNGTLYSVFYIKEYLMKE